MRRWILIAIIALATVLLTAAWVRQDAPRPAIAQTIGILPRTPFDSRFCGWFVRDTPIGAIPTGGVRCDWSRRPTGTRSAELDQLFYHVLSRNVKYAERSWEPASRARWKQDVDSVRAALEARGGISTCERRARQTPTELLEFWRFPDFEVMLFTGRAAAAPGHSQGDDTWALFLRAEPGHHRMC